MENNKFNQSEQIGRDKFTKWINNNCNVCTKITYADNEYSSWDVAYLSGETRVIVEIKDRKVNHDEYYTFLGENVKLKKLQKLKEEDKVDKIIYFNSFSDDIIRTWDITEYTPFITYKKALPKTTDGNNTKVLKDVYDLYSEDSIIYK